MTDTRPYPPLPEMSGEDRRAASRAFLEMAQRRRTCRTFSQKPFAREIVENAIRAAGTAPSGANHQPWHFTIVENAEAKARIREGAEAEEREFYENKASDEWLGALAPLGTDAVKAHLTDAPYLIVVFAQRRGGPRIGDDLQNYYVTESVGIACGLLLASLTSAGIATLTHTPSPMKFLNEICGRPANEKPLMVIACGHPAADATVQAHALIKKSLDDISNWI